MHVVLGCSLSFPASIFMKKSTSEFRTLMCPLRRWVSLLIILFNNFKSFVVVLFPNTFSFRSWQKTASLSLWMPSCIIRWDRAIIYEIGRDGDWYKSKQRRNTWWDQFYVVNINEIDDKWTLRWKIQKALLNFVLNFMFNLMLWNIDKINLKVKDPTYNAVKFSFKFIIKFNV